MIIRHDIDRKPERALKMAEIENDLGVKSTYFFTLAIQMQKRWFRIGKKCTS